MAEQVEQEVEPVMGGLYADVLESVGGLVCAQRASTTSAAAAALVCATSPGRRSLRLA
ncbi:MULTISPECIES: hypothetical protein [unclassified Kitasatospora]|uniref:hypothetical protein n=1 Tax=unclassified Kitasatospora TaxID=2633591 RepID=UPI0034118B15